MLQERARLRTTCSLGSPPNDNFGVVAPQRACNVPYNMAVSAKGLAS